MAGARLDLREPGQGTPLVVLHGGPDFGHAYLLTELVLHGDRDLIPIVASDP